MVLGTDKTISHALHYEMLIKFKCYFHYSIKGGGGGQKQNKVHEYLCQFSVLATLNLSLTITLSWNLRANLYLLHAQNAVQKCYVN